MADCECLGGCPFYNDRMANKPATAEMYKQNFCRGDFSGCARYTIFKSLGKQFVPADLFPNMMDRAKSIIAGTA